MKKDMSWARYFNPQKSPRTQFNMQTGVIEYYPKNSKKRPAIAYYDSKTRGTFRRSKVINKQ